MEFNGDGQPKVNPRIRACSVACVTVVVLTVAWCLVMAVTAFEREVDRRRQEVHATATAYEATAQYGWDQWSAQQTAMAETPQP